MRGDPRTAVREAVSKALGPQISGIVGALL
jgi:hypothetical protein